MAIKKLHETLDELHRQLDDAGSLSDEEREHLVAAMQEIRETLVRTGILNADYTPNEATATSTGAARVPCTTRSSP